MAARSPSPSSPDQESLDAGPEGRAVEDDIDARPTEDLEPEIDEPEVEASEKTPIPRVDPLVAALRRELADRDEQLRSYITAYKQATADMERERERTARERDLVADRVRAEVTLRLLDVLDNLDRSAASCKPGGSIEDLASGLQLVRQQFFEALSELGAERIEALGSTFDAKLHEATGLIPATGKQADQDVVFEERSGYTFKGKLLRASRVVVASRPS